MKKIIIYTFYAMLTAAFILVGVTYHYLHKFSKTQIKVDDDRQYFTLNQGTTPIQLAKQLEKEKLLDDAYLLPYLYKFDPRFDSIKAGTYQLQPYMTVEYFLNLLVSGKESQFSIRFVEGKTSYDWLNILKNTPYIRHTLDGKSISEIADLLDIPNSGFGAIEGWLSPNTYLYTANTSDLEILKRAHLTMKANLQSVWAEREADLPYQTPYQMLIMASIIEKETNRPSERSKIASVFINRLKFKMRLQTDPTIIYGLGENYTGSIRKVDLVDKTNLYNTYLISGLPPTPITMPSLESLIAAAHPAKTDYLYFVANGRGGHTFTSNYKQHQRAVYKYRRMVNN